MHTTKKSCKLTPSRRKRAVSGRKLNRRISMAQTRSDTPFESDIDYDRESEILKVLGHPIRLKIVAGLISQACNVKKIWECLGLPQATVSQHLALLKNKNIIIGRREGVEVYYQVTSPEAIRIVTSLLHHLPEATGR